MKEYPYCVKYDRIIGNLRGKICSIIRRLGINYCIDCPYSQTYIENQLPERYRNKLKYLEKFVLQKWMVRR